MNGEKISHMPAVEFMTMSKHFPLSFLKGYGWYILGTQYSFEHKAVDTSWCSIY